MNMLGQLRGELRKLSNPKKAEILKRFFKTGKGEYGEGDVFLGITVPQSRVIAQKFSHLSLSDIEKLLASKIHEERLIALLLLVHNFQKGDDKARREVYAFYLKNTKYINNWDLVDLSAHQIMGEYLLGQEILRLAQDDILVNLAKSENLWERRIAIVATYAFIRKNQFDQTLTVSKILLHDKHDLIHKAVGWMLREVGKRDQEIEEAFLRKHYKIMPRTSLRYAIERFSEKKRKAYLSKNPDVS